MSKAIQMFRTMRLVSTVVRSLSTYTQVYRPPRKGVERVKTTITPSPLDSIETIGSRIDLINGFKKDDCDFFHGLLESSNNNGFDSVADPKEFDLEMSNWISNADLNHEKNMARAFEILDIIYVNNINSKLFVNSLLIKLFQQLDENHFNIDVFKRLLFTIILSKRILTIDERLKIESMTIKYFLPSHPSLNDIAMVTSAFYKTESKITDQRIIMIIIELLEADLVDNNSTVHNISYASIFKCLRHSFSNENAQSVRTLIKSIDANMIATNILDRFDRKSLLHLNRMAWQYRQPNGLISEMLIKKCVGDPDASVKSIKHALRIAFDFHVDVPASTIDTFVKRVSKEPDIYFNHRYAFHFLGFVSLIVPRTKLTTEVVQLIKGVKRLKENGNWLQLYDGQNGDTVVKRSLLHLNTLIQLHHPKHGPLLTTAEVTQLSMTSVNNHDPLTSDLSNCSRFDFSYTLLYKGLKYVTKSPYKVLSKKILPGSIFPELIIPLTEVARIQVINHRYTLEPLYFKNCLLIKINHRNHYSDSEDTILCSSHLDRLESLKLLGFDILDIHWLNIFCASPELIGFRIKKMLEESIEKGSIDPMFKDVFIK